jgi:hypothetical protein
MSRAARVSRPLRAFLVALKFALCATFVPATVRAQHCRLAPSDAAASGFDFSLRGEAARFRTARYEGDYQGLFLRGAFATRALSLSVALPHYHIVRNGLGSSGFGDSILEGSARLISTRDELASAGVQLILAVPTGDSKHDLGMGHWMLAPTAWASVTRDRFTLEAHLGYGRAFGGSTQHVHGKGSQPIVDPMNHSEIEAALSALARVHRHLRTRISVYGAEALPASEGVARAATSFAGDLLWGQARFSMEAHLPLLGDAFRGKLAAELGFAF